MENETSRNQARRATHTDAWVNHYRVGDVFSTCWGYDQTNREYYQVVEVRGQYLIVRELRQCYRETQSLAGYTSPIVGDFIGKPARVLARDGGFREPKHRHYWASYEEPMMIDDIKTYPEKYVSSYA